MTLTARPRLLIRFAVLAALALCGIVLALSSTGTPPVGAQDGSVPAKPTGVVATATHDSVALSWDDPGDASITHYQIFRRDRDVHDAGEFVTIEDDTGSAATSYTDDTVEPETRYVYRVKAVNAHGASNWSDYRRANTPAAPDPADLAPSSLEVSLVENRVTLSWDAPASDAASVIGYEILRRRPNEGEAALTTLVADTGNAETGYTDDTANEPGVRYTYRVKALRDGEQSRVSNYARIDLPDDYAQDTSGSDEPTPTPEALAPSGLTAEAAEDGGVALSWTAPAEDAGSVTGYEVLRAQGSAALATLAADTGSTDTAYTDSGVTGDLDDYRYQVKALRGGDASQGSNVAGVLQSAHAGAIVPLADVTLISNLGQSSAGGGNFANDQAQAFTTGSNSGGYSLTKVVIESRLSEDADFTVSVHENNSGAPGTSLGTLTKPTLPVTDAREDYEFTHSGIDLAASTTYFIVVDVGTSSSEFTIYNTSSDAEDTGGATGWSIGDSSLFRSQSSTGSWTTWAQSKHLSMTGTVKGATTNSPATGAPAISGTPAVGELLTANTSNIGDPDGIADADFEYQWIAFDGTTDSDISGATGETYRPLLAHLAQTIKVRVSFDDDNDNAESLTSAATAAVTASPYGQVIWGAAVSVGTHTTSSAGFTVDSFGYLNQPTNSYGAIDHSMFTHSGVNYTVSGIGYSTLSSAGVVISNIFSVVVNGSLPDSAGFRVSGKQFPVSEVTTTTTDAQGIVTYGWDDAGLTWTDGQEVEVRLTVNRPATGAPTISGTPAVGELLTVDISNIGDPDGIADADFEYQWIAFDGTTDSDISGATGETYRPLLAHVGQTIKVRVTFDDDDDNAESLTSAATAAVTASTYGQVIWAATLTVEEETVAAGTFFGYYILAGRGSLEPTGFTYERGANVVTTLQYIEGDIFRFATNHSLVSGDFNLYVDGAPFLIESPGTTTRFAFSDHGLTWTDEQEVEVRLTVNRPATGAPAITGTPAVGETLTAGISGIMDDDGLPVLGEITYQWISDDSDIDGATDSTYTLMDADEGKTIKVRVSFTDNAKFPESLTSAATGPVTAAVAALVSNVGQTAAGNANVIASQSQGQGFTTGSDSGGYTLGSVELAVSSFSGTASDITVSIYSESSGDPGTVVHTLTTPASISTPVTTFTAPSGTTLAASTTYYLVISTTGSGINLSRTNATAEDTGGVSGWSIADSGRVFAANAWRTTTSPFRMRVNGGTATTGIWSATLTVAIGGSFYGYSGIIDVGDLEPAEFTYNGNPATVQVLAYSGNVFYLQTSPALDSGDYLLILDDTPIQLGTASGSPPRHQVSDHGLTWTTDQQVEVRLALNNEPTGEPVITGTPEVSQTLTSDISGIMDTDGRPADDQFFYQWIQSDGATDSDISGATNATYKLGRADLGKTIKVRVTFTDGGGFPETLTSDATGPVTHLTVSSDWSLTPSSLNPGDRFRLMFLTTIRNATPTDIDVYNEWVQGRAAGGHDDIRDYAGAFNLLGCTEDDDARDNTGTTYTSSDKGVAIYWLNGNKVVDDYEDLYDGDWDEEAKMRTRSGTEKNNPEYVFTGCRADGTSVGQYHLGSDDEVALGKPNSTDSTHGPISSTLISAKHFQIEFYALSDVFEVAVPTTDVPVNWSLIPSGLSAGDQFRLLFISSGGRNATPTSIDTYNAWIQDRAAAGHTDIQGYSSTFNVVGSTADVDARDNTGTIYTSGSSYKGVPIYWLNVNKVADDYEDFYDGDWDEEASMRTQAGTSRGAPLNLWTGSGHNGTEARTGNNASRALGKSDVAVGWPNDSTSGIGPLGTAEAWNSEKGDSKQLYGLSGVFRVVAVANTPATGKPTISGTPQVNQTLTADISSIMDADGLPAAGQFSYQWISDDGTGDSDIDGATDSTYTLVFADYGNTIKVRVSFTDDNDYPESLTSTAVGVASPYGDVIHSALLTVGIGAFFSGYSSNTNTGVLEPANFTHNGNPAGVQVLAYSGNEFYFQTSPALGSGDYGLILDDTPIQLGAASGSPLRHQVSDHGLTWTADQQVEVWLVLNNEPTGKPTISGTPQVNLTLTADISSIMDADGLPAAGQFSYQWISDDSDIDGATGSTYTLVQADAGKTIKVRVSFTDSSNFPESLTSAPTVTVLEMMVPEVPADWSLVPSGLLVGDQFRLLFVSSTGRDATSDIIATYNTWIQNLAAAGHTDIQRYYSTFTVVGSTAAVDAQDNTHTTYTSSDKGVPIYWLNGNKVADQYEDFYDGSWDDEANRKTEAGTASSDTTIRTGSDPDGTEKGFGAFSLALGKSLATVGIPDSSATGSGPLSSDTNAADSSTLPLYGLSGVFTVVAPPPTEVPSTWSLIPSGLGVGDEFRLLFVSSTTRTPQATGIGTYNTYVQNRAAAGHTDIRDYSDTFRVVGCTDARDARDNTYTTYTSSDKGVPIYWLNGNKVVDQYEDFYDGSWDDQANPKTEAGTSTSATTIWTGCDEDGTEAIHIGGTASRALGTFSVAFGDLDHATLGPVGHPNNIGGNALSKPFYGLSAVFRVGQGPPTVVPADWSLIPSGLGAGQEFRLLFLSSTKRSIRSTNISDYNTFVQNRAAAGHTDIQDYSDTFRVLGSTGAKDARDNTGTTYTSSDKGVRIYWLNGDKAADQYEDFYDGSWDQQADAWNESGVEYDLSARRYVATGSSKNGTTDQSNPLGASSGEVQLGCLYETSSINGPVSCNFTTENISADNNQQLYGLSGVFQVTTNNATGKPVITGTPEVRQTLTADISGIMDEDGLPADDQFSYQWIRSDGADDSDISGATNATYKLKAADQGKTIKVRVTFTDEGGTEETLTSDATTAVAADTTGPVVEEVSCIDSVCTLVFDELLDENLNNVPLTVAFAITADGAAITVGIAFPLIDGRFQVSSLAPQIRQGQTVKVKYTDPTSGDDTKAIQDAAGNDAADFTTGEDGVPAVTNDSTLALVAPGAPTGLTATPNGATQIDLAWTAPADNGGRVVKGYQIEYSDDGGTSWSVLVADTQSTDTMYSDTTLSGGETRHYRVSAINSIGTGAASNSPPTGKPAITGTPEVNQTLAADVSGIMDANGVPAADQFSYQWIRNDGTTDSDISGATDSTYKLKAADLGKTIKVRVTFTDEGGTEETLTSDATTAVAADTTGPVVEQVICVDSSCNLFFDEPQSSNVDHYPPTRAFAITADGAAITVGSALPGGGNRVLLTQLAPQIYQGQTVIVTYTDPTAGNDEAAIQDEAGNDAASFTTGEDDVPAVTNNSTAVLVTEVPADWSLIPSGLGPGDHFRLIFLSSATRTAEATDIATYNTWIQGLAAAGHADIQDYSSTFRVVGSTAAVDARDNTGTTGTGVPIHWLDGDKAADDYEDFYDETWDEEASIRDESGTTVTPLAVFTGSNHDGTKTGRPLGTNVVTVGIPNSPVANDGPLSSDISNASTSDRHLYALSGVFEVSLIITEVPADWSLVPSGLGPGDHFRLIFLSSATRTAEATDIATYNTWIQGLAAAGHADIQDYSSTFRVVGSTAAVDARDNTGTTGTGVPIHWLDGDKAADDYEDFYDETWDEEASIRDESGTTVTPLAVFTGSNHDGTKTGRPLGTNVVTVGIPNSPVANDGPLSSDISNASTSDRHLYALSGVFEVVAASNSTPTGKPVITGTPEVKQTLTADISGIVDTDGLPAADQFSYQWVRNDGTDDTDISGATDSTYTLEAADLGKTIKVKVTFTDEGGTEETLTSDATTAVAADTTGPTLTGAAVDRSGFSIDLEFDENLDTDLANLPQPGDFTVTTDGVVGTVENALLGTAATTIALSVSPRIYQGQTVTVTYDDPTAGNDANAIQDAAGNDAADFTTGEDDVPAVTNNSNLVPSTVALVSNADRTIEGAISRTIQAQSFVTGPSTGGYTLSTIQIRLGDDSALPGVTDLIAAVKADDGSGEPGALVANLANPASLTNDALNTFTAPTGTVLAPDTTYWVVVNEDRSDSDWVNLRVTAQDEEDEAFPGWSIGNNHLSKVSASGSWNHGATVSNLTVVNGSVIVGDTDSTPPTLTGAAVDRSGFSIDLEFDENLDTDLANLPQPGDFTVTTDGVVGTVENALLGTAATTIALSVSPRIYQGQTVTVTYDDPMAGNDANAIQDAAGNDAADFTTGEDDVPAVTNNSNLAPVAPGAPTGLTATASGGTQIDLAWTAPATSGGRAITGYQIEYSDDGGTSWSVLVADTQSTDTMYSDTTLSGGDTRHYRVSAINSIDTGAASTVANATTASGPGVASVTVDHITQTSAAVTVTVANLQNASHTVYLRYRVEGGSWPAAANQSTPTSGTAVTFTLTGLTGNTDYDVAASLARNFASGVKTAAFTTSPTKPGKTRSVAIGVGNGLLPITWTPPLSDGGSAITGYTVQWKSGSQSFGGDPSREHTTTGASVTAYFITGLTNGTEYTVRVIAVNAVGDGPPSDEWTQTPVGPPDAPPNMQAGSGHEQLTVSWGAPNDRGSAITEYRLQWKSPGQSFNSSRQRTIAAPSRTDTIPSLTNGAEYAVRVRATNASGNGPWSAEAKGTPREGPHVSLVKVKEPISCTVTFVALEFVNLEPATEYHAHLRFRAQGSSSWTVLSPRSFWSSGIPSGAAGGELNGPSPAFTLPFLAYETTYEVQAALDSGFVDGLAATTFSTPNLSEVGLMPLSPGDGTLGLRMSEPDSGGQVVGYLVQWKSGDEEYDDTDTSERQADVPGSGDREYTITGLDNGVEYTVRAMAYNDNGVGVPTIDVKGTPEAPPNSPARGAPTISGTARVGETLTADTDGIEDDDGLADAVYSYQWLADGLDISGATGETYTPAYDDERKVIRVKVSFIDDRDFEETLTSEPTAEVEADPDAPTEPPNAPRTVRIVGDTNTSLTLTWDAPDGGTAVTEYRVQWLTVGENFATARRDGREAVLGASARSHTITGLSTGEFYQVRVLAVNGAGESEGSNTDWGFPGLGGYGQE